MLEVLVKKAPTVRFTQDNKTPLAEIEVEFDSLRADDPPCALKVVGWGKLAEELQNTVQINSKLVIIDNIDPFYNEKLKRKLSQCDTNDKINIDFPRNRIKKIANEFESDLRKAFKEVDKKKDLLQYPRLISSVKKCLRKMKK